MSIVSKRHGNTPWGYWTDLALSCTMRTVPLSDPLVDMTLQKDAAGHATVSSGNGYGEYAA